jgi:hypothetical protein
MPRAPRWTDAQLTEAVAASRSLAEVCRRLGLAPGGGTYRTLRRHLDRLGVRPGGVPVPEPARRRRRWTEEEFVAAVRESATVAGVLRRLGHEPNGGMHRLVVRKIANLGLDTSHFTGRSWAKGLTLPRGPRRPLEQALVVNSTFTNTARLRERLVAAGLKQASCELCGLAEWRGRPLPLALDHVNGVHTDNRLENLRILCPNCHAQTDTWCARNRRAGVAQRQRHGP